MKNTLKVLPFFAFVALWSVWVGTAQAALPVLTLTATDGNLVRLEVAADANSNVLFGYVKTGGEQFLNSLGKTDAVGRFIVTINTSEYNIQPSSIAKVTVNGQRSNELAWPSLGTSAKLSISETAVALSNDQTKALAVTGNGSNPLYVANNSNPPVANANITGNQIVLHAINLGSTVVTICSNPTSPVCVSVYVNVQSGAVAPLAFSQSNVSVASGQTLPLSIFGAAGSYIVTNNSNTTAIQATISGSNLNLKALASSGYSAITVCSSDLNSCGVVNATAATLSSTGLQFSQNNPVIQYGQTVGIGLSGGSTGTYSIFSNSNATSVSAYLSGNTLKLVGLNGGNATVTVCSGGACGSVFATVTYADNGTNIKLSQNNLWLNVGQSQTVAISGGTMPYSVLNPSSKKLGTKIENNILTLTGYYGGTLDLSVCSASGGCTALSVLVNGPSLADDADIATTTATVPVTTENLVLGQTKLQLKVAEAVAVSLKGSGGYYVFENLDPAVATAVVNPTYLSVKALAVGETEFKVCQSDNQCAMLKIIVTAPTAEKPATRVVTIKTVTPAKMVIVKFKFKKEMQLGLNSNDVKELQKRLINEKLFKGKVSGKFDWQTKAAVQKYQKKKNIRQTGNVGPQTLQVLNK